MSAQPIKINIVLHETDIFGLERVPYVSISLLFEDTGKNYYYRRALTTYESIIQDGGEYLSVTDNVFNEDERHIDFRICIDQIRLLGNIDKLVSTIAINGGLLYKDRDSPSKNWWVVQIPLGSFRANLDFQGTCRQLDGFAYLDHTWGTAPIQNHFRDWVWGYFAQSGNAAQFYRIGTIDRKIIDRGAIISRTCAMATDKLITPFLDVLATMTKPEEVKLDSWVVFPHQDRKIEFSLKETDLMRVRVDEPHPGFVTTYCRWNAIGRGEDVKPKELLAGVVEYLRIRRRETR